MRRTKKGGALAVVYEFVQPEVLERLHGQGIRVEYDQQREPPLWTVYWPISLKQEAHGDRVGIQLYDNSTCVTTYGKVALRLYATQPADPLHRPSFADLYANKRAE